MAALASIVIGGKYRSAADRRRAAQLTDGEILRLERDPKNPADPNAVKVVTFDGHHIGFIPRTLAAELAPKLDAGVGFCCSVKGNPRLYDYPPISIEELESTNGKAV